MVAKEGVTVSSWKQAVADNSVEWAELIRSHNYNPTLGPGWLGTIIATVASDYDINVLVRRVNGRLEAIIPFFIQNSRIFGIPVRILELTSNLISYHAELISRNDPVPLFEELFARTPDWHVCRLANLRDMGETAMAVEEIARRTNSPLVKYISSASPYLPISGTWEEFVSSRSKKFRYKLRKRREQLIENSSLEMRWFSSRNCVETLMQHILEVEGRSWKADAGIAISDRMKEQQYHEYLLPYLAKQDALMANVLYHESTPIAYNLCCIWHGWVGQLKTSFANDYRELSPGSIVIDAAIEETFRRQAREFDFLGDSDPHKLTWTKKVRRHADYFLFRAGTRGQLIGLVKAWRHEADRKRE